MSAAHGSATAAHPKQRNKHARFNYGGLGGVLHLLLTLAASSTVANAKSRTHRHPQQGDLPGGLPKGLMGGPPWRLAIDKVFKESCDMNKGAVSVFCFPNRKALLDALQVEQYGIDMTSQTYLLDVHVVIEQLLQWPPAWPLVIEVLNPKEPWTYPFCDTIVGSEWWQGSGLVRKSFLKPAHTLAQLEKDAPIVAASMNRWFESLRISGNSRTQQLLKELRAKDADDVKNRSCHAWPTIKLMQQVHSGIIRHIWGTACKKSKAAIAKLTKPDKFGFTMLHHAASSGNVAAARAILKAVPKNDRQALLAKGDKSGYTALDWARLGNFNSLIEAIQPFADKQAINDLEVMTSSPVDRFPPWGENSSDTSSQCSDDGEAGGNPPSCKSDTGGWNSPMEQAVPGDWLPQNNPDSCEIDSIDHTQFRIEVFYHHYLLHPRPLLIRGGAQFENSMIRQLTKQGIIESAGDRKVELYTFPSAREFEGTKPQVKRLEEYVTSLQANGAMVAESSKPPRFVYARLPPEEIYLNFTTQLPSLLAENVDLLATNVLIGGPRSGMPPHHKSPTSNSLVFGKQAWFLERPGEEFVAHEPVYEYLVRSDGARGAARCLQEAGDLLYVPRSWTSAVICLSECVNIAHEFSHKEWDLRDQ